MSSIRRTVTSLARRPFHRALQITEPLAAPSSSRFIFLLLQQLFLKSLSGTLTEGARDSIERAPLRRLPSYDSDAFAASSLAVVRLFVGHLSKPDDLVVPFGTRWSPAEAFGYRLTYLFPKQRLRHLTSSRPIYVPVWRMSGYSSSPSPVVPKILSASFRPASVLSIIQPRARHEKYTGRIITDQATIWLTIFPSCLA